MEYLEFLHKKIHEGSESGFEPTFMPDILFPFQKALSEWSIRKGRSALFEDCGLGKTLQQLTWAENVLRHTGKPVLVLTPPAVAFQTVIEGNKIGIDVQHRRDGKKSSDGIVVTNYERLHYFNADDFAGVVGDESSILKNFDGAIKAEVTDFMRKVPYRLLCTATAAPNDYIELGTSSEALGEMGFVDMLSKFFKKSEATYTRRQEHMAGLYRFHGHAERDFWRWVCSWARAIRKPSDLGFEDGAFKLPEIEYREHEVEARTKADGMLFDLPARSFAGTARIPTQDFERTMRESCGAG